MVEIRELVDLKGKTIIDTYKYMGELWLKFSDDSFVVLVINDKTEGFGYSEEEIDINEYQKNNTDRPLVELGIITEKEWNKAIKEEEIEFEKYCLEQEKKEIERIEKYEIEQLKKLEEKYKNGHSIR